VARCKPSFTNCSICGKTRLSAATLIEALLWNHHRMGKVAGKIGARWNIGEHVTTPDGFIAEILSVTEERALVRHLSMEPASGETDSSLGLLRPVTARDLILAIERRRPKGNRQ
jgi:hypothetical protein